MSWLEDLVPGPVVRRASAYTVPAVNGQVVVFTALGAATDCTLPLTPVLGQLVIVKHAATDGFGVVVQGNGKLIDGATYLNVAGDYACAMLCYDGVSWAVLNMYHPMPA